MSTPAGWYTQPDGQQMYWNGQKYTNTWSAESGAVPNPAGNGSNTPTHEDGAQTAWGAPVATADPQAQGFFASLFDFGFTSFITLKLLSVIYGLLVVLVALASAGILAVGISEGGTRMVLSIVGTPIVALVYLVLARVSMEMIALFFRIGQNTNLMVASASSAGLHSRGVDAARA